MSIEMTQDFVYETDDLKLFRTVLITIIPVLFRSGRQKILLREPRDCSWDAGEEESWHDTQPEILDATRELNACYHLETTGTYHGAVFQHLGAEFKTKDEAAAAAVAQRTRPRPTRRWITRVFEYGTYARGTYATPLKAALVDSIMYLVQSTDRNAFLRDFRAVEPDTDGNVGVGYRMQLSRDALDISMVHVVYHK